MNTPTLIGMPEPPSNPDTPTETPGTPNSTTTSLSALSTTAFKDGHRGNSFPHTGHGHRSAVSNNTLEAERADRISRLAGLERVSAVRPPNPSLFAAGGGGQAAGVGGGQIPGYFDQNGNPVYTTAAKMSTVGSASATGSIGGRTTTWASGSVSQGGEGDVEDDVEGDGDQMSMDANFRDMDERDRYSASAVDEDGEGYVDGGDGMSDNTSLVGFGEGAGSTVSGPTYSRKDFVTSSAVSRSGLGREGSGVGSSAMGSGTNASAVADPQQQRPGSGIETAERIIRERLDDGEGKKPVLGSPDEAGLGKFYFEEKK